MTSFHVLLPEIILVAVGSLLILMGMARGAGARRLAPVLAVLGLALAFAAVVGGDVRAAPQEDPTGAARVYWFSDYVKMITAGVGILLVLLAWPNNASATAGTSIHFGAETSEFFGMMLYALAGVMLVAGANDLALLFMGIELASIPTYVLVAVSRPLPAAQEAGVKYFFLGALSAAILLFGFSYLYGVTGHTNLMEIARHFRADAPTSLGQTTLLSPMATFAVVLVVIGLAFKLAAVPLHVYAGDVYQGAATPVTAFLSFVPKITGFVALVKVMFVATGGSWAAPESLATLLGVLAVLTMTVGNVLGLMQVNLKRIFACSSIAHSGYMLAAVAVMVGPAGNGGLAEQALAGLLLYLAAYGLMNAAALGVLMMLPARQPQIATSAETYDDIAGAGRDRPALGLAMAISCFSLIGLPLTIGFFSKLYLLKPALLGGQVWLAIFMVANAAISAGYYLKIVGTMFLKPERFEGAETPPADLVVPMPLKVAVAISAVGTVLFGALPPATEVLDVQASQATQVDRPVELQTPAADPAVDPAVDAGG